MVALCFSEDSPPARGRLLLLHQGWSGGVVIPFKGSWIAYTAHTTTREVKSTPALLEQNIYGLCVHYNYVHEYCTGWISIGRPPKTGWCGDNLPVQRIQLTPNTNASLHICSWVKDRVLSGISIDLLLLLLLTKIQLAFPFQGKVWISLIRDVFGTIEASQTKLPYLQYQYMKQKTTTLQQLGLDLTINPLAVAT